MDLGKSHSKGETRGQLCLRNLSSVYSIPLGKTPLGGAHYALQKARVRSDRPPLPVDEGGHGHKELFVQARGHPLHTFHTCHLEPWDGGDRKRLILGGHDLSQGQEHRYQAARVTRERSHIPQCSHNEQLPQANTSEYLSQLAELHGKDWGCDLVGDAVFKCFKRLAPFPMLGA